MKAINSKAKSRERRRNRIRAKISGTSQRPRLSVFKSNSNISAQIIDDSKSVTLVSVHSREVKGKTRGERATLVGKLIAEKAKTKKISKVAFDRGGFIYTGNIKALADGAREGGLKF